MDAKAPVRDAAPTESRPGHWAVVGGGMLGLTLALRLTQNGQRVTVLEAAPSLGGLASAWQVEDVVWDRYYHVIMLSDARLRALLSELELEDEIRWSVTKTNFFTGTSMYPLNNSFDYIRLPVLSLVDKARLGATIVFGSRIENGRPLEKVSAESWLSRWSGRSAYRNLWRPLLRSKLGSNHGKASAAYIWSVIRRFYAARRGGLKTEMFGYVPGGYRRILAALADRLRDSGVTLETGRPVASVVASGKGFQVTAGDETRHFDRVINTCASPIAMRICEGLKPAERKQHHSILYQGIVCASLLLNRPLGGAYLTYITDETIPFTTVIEMSSLIERSEIGGRHLLYLPKYLPVDDPLLDADDAEIEAAFLPALQRLFPDLTRDAIKAFKVTRTRHVLAVSTLNYSDNLPPMATSIPGLYIVNSAQIVNASLSVDESVNLANEAVASIMTRDPVFISRPGQ
ncbi:FAD-dependent oxidoreductase [Denitrobaculum tricleocarpae]|uniref:FAD-dependent oxidoreductase n=1 Tax=Denitrobaculum tricleocarpae TaxID=2591009 RepID=A0A545U1K1_9PROT|nr:FAD-dependent oxidoreductase [Denitrobaculum tricleocarpae]TQV83338.1 FAD-dependent oxidoreductase [Denitrobaculum tricleocarpae]